MRDQLEGIIRNYGDRPTTIEKSRLEYDGKKDEARVMEDLPSQRSRRIKLNELPEPIQWNRWKGEKFILRISHTHGEVGPIELSTDLRREFRTERQEIPSIVTPQVIHPERKRVKRIEPFAVLSTIDKEGGKVSSKSYLADKLGTSRPTLNERLEPLEEEGLIEYPEGCERGRPAPIETTEEGKKSLEKGEEFY